MICGRLVVYCAFTRNIDDDDDDEDYDDDKETELRVEEEEAELTEAVKEVDTDEVVILKEKRQSMCLQL